MDSRHQQFLIPAIETAIDAVVLIDENHCVRFFNCAAERLWGYDRNDVIGKEVTLLFAGDIGIKHDGSVDREQSSDENGIAGVRREVRLKRKDDREIWGALSLSKVESGGKSHFMGLVRDVTEEVRGREESRLLSLAANETDRAMLVLDRDRRIIYINRAFTDLFGYGLTDVRGKQPTDLRREEHTETDSLVAFRQKLLGTQSFVDDILVFDRHNNAMWVSAAANMVLDAQGDVANVVIALTDITLLKHIQSLQDDVLEALASDLSLPEVADFLCRRVEEIAPEIISSILLVDAERKLRPLAGPKLPAVYCEAVDGFPAGEIAGSCGTAVWRGESVYVTDIDTDPLWAPYKHLALPHGLRACWSSPIRLKDGHIAGTFAFYYREPRGPNPFHQQMVKACLHLCKLAIERDEARRQIAQLSHFDPLTGLSNRIRVLDEAGEIFLKTTDKNRKIAFFAIDLDRFKDVNNSLGHAIGDKVLVTVAGRLKEVFANLSSVMGRTGGDSFVVVLPDCDVARASATANKIIQALSRPTDIPSFSLCLSVSIGISIFPDNGKDSETLLKYAETAMYQAKSAGRATHRFFSSEMNRLAEDRLVLGSALRNALSSHLLKLHYQPQVNLSSKKLYGVEALARWNDSEFGNIPPDRFIPLAEEIGLIEAIGRWSLREACEQMVAWRKAGIAVPMVSVNLSPLHFRNGGLAEFVASLLSELNLPAHCLTVEITERVMMDGGHETLRTLAALHEIGVGLSMDDFGIGFSSLSSLTQMPINELKLDRSFMHNFEIDPSAQAVTTAIVRIGQSLGMTVVSEGVETAEQVQILQMLDCSVAQGYYFARPMPPRELERWMFSAALAGEARSKVSA